jgi:hypothetical protein
MIRKLKSFVTSLVAEAEAEALVVERASAK